jgi:hypothetical protein
VKYPESNNMHKKMLHVRERLIQIENSIKKLDNDDSKPEISSKIDHAWEEIYKAQCNDAYWHGMFGGVYLQFLRFAVYTHLIKAEKLIDEINSFLYPAQKADISFTPLDFNKDSRMDIIIESKLINTYINPADGGTIFELDYKPESYNLLNTLTRWSEAYHDSDKIDVKELKVDRFRRSMLRMRFMHKDTSLEELHADTYYEFADFVDGEFEVVSSQKEQNSVIIDLEKQGSVKDSDSDQRIDCSILKKILVENNKVLIKINGELNDFKGKEEILENIIKNINLVVDIPFFFNGDPSKFRWESATLVVMDGVEKELLEPFQYYGENFKAFDATYNLNFEILVSCNTGKIKFNKFPIIAYAYTDEGYKKIYQGINVSPQFTLDKTFGINIELSISS